MLLVVIFVTKFVLGRHHTQKTLLARLHSCPCFRGHVAKCGGAFLVWLKTTTSTAFTYYRQVSWQVGRRRRKQTCCACAASEKASFIKIKQSSFSGRSFSVVSECVCETEEGIEQTKPIFRSTTHSCSAREVELKVAGTPVRAIGESDQYVSK